MIADELSQDDIDALLGGMGGDDESSADDALAALSGDDGGASAAAAPARTAPSSSNAIDLPEFDDDEAAAQSAEKLGDLLSDVNLNVKIRLGRCVMAVEDIMRLQAGKVVQLDSMSGDPVDILVNGRLVAKGEVIILNEAFCVRITDIFSIQEKLERQA